VLDLLFEDGRNGLVIAGFDFCPGSVGIIVTTTLEKGFVELAEIIRDAGPARMCPSLSTMFFCPMPEWYRRSWNNRSSGQRPAYPPATCSSPLL
jgi:hypothetical protein